MTRNEFIASVIAFCEKETQKIIAKLQENRFLNDGAFNDHEEWTGNSPKVIKDKGFDKPLFDTGELKDELTDPENWDLEPKFSNNVLTLTIPDKEEFTDSKYDVLDTGGNVDPYTSPRGNKIYISVVPPRPFKDISSQDIDWITKELVEAIKREYA